MKQNLKVKFIAAFLALVMCTLLVGVAVHTLEHASHASCERAQSTDNQEDCAVCHFFFSALSTESVTLSVFAILIFILSAFYLKSEAKTLILKSSSRAPPYSLA
ncbi:MAG: hypothetical protein R3Y38_05040 [Rikenellaceae bacterium]